jgi:hypothetical protein
VNDINTGEKIRRVILCAEFFKIDPVDVLDIVCWCIGSDHVPALLRESEAQHIKEPVKPVVWESA